MALTSGFSLALGGGGARGFAHVGVAEALAERGLVPGRIVGTSMGSVIGAGLAAGLTAERIVELASRFDPWRMARRPARLGIFDHRPLMERIVAEVGHPQVEDLPIPFAAATYDLVSGRHELITRGPVADALIRSCAISVVFAPIIDGEAIWADAGVWEPVPISLTRAWSTEPVVGVQVIAPKPACRLVAPRRRAHAGDACERGAPGRASLCQPARGAHHRPGGGRPGRPADRAQPARGELGPIR